MRKRRALDIIENPCPFSPPPMHILHHKSFLKKVSLVLSKRKRGEILCSVMTQCWVGIKRKKRVRIDKGFKCELRTLNIRGYHKGVTF